MLTQKQIQKNRSLFYSQNGEEGVLSLLLERLPDRNNWAVEFGAWDGQYLSNTWFLLKNNYRGVLIEGDAKRFLQLQENTASMRDRVTCLNRFVSIDGENRLDAVLSETAVPQNFDLLSIDIDGNDYHVWKSLENYRPKIVIIEINIRDRPGKLHVHDPADTTFQWGFSGSSISSMTALAREKGYCLVTNVSCNAIFVDRKYLSLFLESEPGPEEVFTYESFSIAELSLRECRKKGARFLRRKLMRLPFEWLGLVKTLKTT